MRWASPEPAWAATASGDPSVGSPPGTCNNNDNNNNNNHHNHHHHHRHTNINSHNDSNNDI